jgi:alpha-L-rhamnosidase
MAISAFYVLLAAAAVTASNAQPLPTMTEPFPLLHGENGAGGPAEPASPDPLVRTTWSASGINLTALQRYETLAPVKWVADPPSAFSGLETLGTGKPNITVNGKGTLRLDWGVERPAWMEFTSPDLGDQATSCSAAISEYNEPWQVKAKVKAVTAYANGKYRLETNQELYEGVRFSWIIFEPQELDGAVDTAPPSWHITSLRLVSQVKPANYTGSFHCSDPEVTGSWWSGAYGSKVNMCVSRVFDRS